MNHAERRIHLAILCYLRTVLPDAIVHHSPNGLDMSGPEAKRQVAKHKHLGMVVGWPDLTIIHGGRIAFMEVKTDKGRLSDDQKDLRTLIDGQGVPYAVVRSVDGARAALAAWNIQTRETA